MAVNITLSIIIVNYNGKQYLKECLNSIKEKCQSISHEVIVYDNNSQDGSVNYLKKNFPDVVLIESDTNYGFAGGNNRAVKHAKGEFILLLNHDTILLSNIEPAIDLLTSRSNVGAVGINMFNGKKQYLRAVGKFPKPTDLIRISNLNYSSDLFVNGDFGEAKSIDVDWLTGSFILTKKEYWNKVAGLDEDYFMYVEDVDFCKKLIDKGLHCVFMPQLSYIHFVGFNQSREHKLLEGYSIYAKKHFGQFGRLTAKLALGINYIVKKMKGKI
jgi:GT2 family glycosyltransferase